MKVGFPLSSCSDPYQRIIIRIHQFLSLFFHQSLTALTSSHSGASGLVACMRAKVASRENQPALALQPFSFTLSYKEQSLGRYKALEYLFLVAGRLSCEGLDLDWAICGSAVFTRAEVFLAEGTFLKVRKMSNRCVADNQRHTSIQTGRWDC